MSSLAILADGFYPFIDEMLPLSEMVMGLPPPELASLIAEQALRSGTPVRRDEVVELKLAHGPETKARFVVFWPSDDPQLYMLMPKRFVRGKA
ncbi:hypothetical protein P7D22_14680 [Lichenihabitans sp. Uapishka_5]|uniref:hypothetical protein n=1 Tax=Lichenihabitans sp. Uapishka_5 TaxID=3037302 RepID=UPI0029E8215D|nr:hypothetical protein [Lichenihabitans sp. Uapishka_5]MDX7952414.1 hypothetical protein [Lichenihabitans sp. Uapishka_5]